MEDYDMEIIINNLCDYYEIANRFLENEESYELNTSDGLNKLIEVIKIVQKEVIWRRSQ